MMADEILEFFDRISSLYQGRFQTPLWDKYPGHRENSLDAIRIFLEGYAFEHQGRNPAYSHASIEAIKIINETLLDQNIAERIWVELSRFLAGKKLNVKLNPLYHIKDSCRCIWCVVSTENIIQTAKQTIASNEIMKAWEKIKYIRGVGSKIASLFLRDIAVQIEQVPNRDRWLLQPVDVWIRRGISLISKSTMSDEEIAKWLVENSAKPEIVNQGIWYFGSQIAGSEFRLKRSIEDLDYAHHICQEHVASLKAAVKAYSI